MWLIFFLIATTLNKIEALVEKKNWQQTVLNLVFNQLEHHDCHQRQMKFPLHGCILLLISQLVLFTVLGGSS